MKILHVVHSLVPGEYRGGISKVAHELAAAQARAGHLVEVLTTTMNSRVPTDIAAGTVTPVDGVTIRYFHAAGSRGARGYSPTLRQHLLEVASGFDALHGHNPLTPLSRYLAEAARRSGPPLFTHLHGALNPYGQQSWYRYFRRLAYVRCIEAAAMRANQGLFCLSEHESREAVKLLGFDNTRIIPNGTSLAGKPIQADGQRFRERYQLGDAPVLLFMGRIFSIKGVHLLAEAFVQLAAERPDLRLVLVGSREQFPDYVAQVDAILAPWSHRVTWTGFLNDQQKFDALSAATVFCHPSESEGMAMAVLEAMAAGAPCLLGKGCFMKDAATAGAILECEFAAESIRRQAHRLLHDDSLRQHLARRGPEHIAAHHSWDAIAQQTISAYGGASVSNMQASSRAA
ncbi:MAG: glycosyltransferase [Planctomycetales bacterium]|nr:glycosyltransferase [Planctomycetales bacterium]